MAPIPPDASADPVDGSRPTVSWFELFYDLVVVAAVSLANDAFLTKPSAQTALVALLSTTALSWIWFMTTLVNNMFPGQDLLRRGLLLVQMAAIVVAGLSVDQETGLSNGNGLAACGVATAIVAVLMIRSGRDWPTRHLLRATAPVILSATLFLAGGVLDLEAAALVVVIALAASVIPIFASEYSRWQDRSALRLDHLRERLGLFVLIILGEGFAQLVHALDGVGSIPRGGIFVLTFLLAFALWWIYFDGTFSDRTDLGAVRWRLSLLGHLTLVFGMMGTLDVLVLLTAQDEEALGDSLLMYFATSVATVFFSFALLGFTTHGRIGRTGWLHIASGLLVLAAALLLVPGSEASTLAVITGCAVIVVVNAALAVWASEPGRSRQGAWHALLRG